MRYSVTTPDPGARDVLTKRFTLSPLATADWARRPAAISTEGLLHGRKQRISAISDRRDIDIDIDIDIDRDIDIDT